MDLSRAKSPNIGNVLNARKLARRKLQRSARREQEKQEIEKKEEEEKESLAWKVLSEEQTQTLKELTVHELEVKLAEVLSIENYHISLPEACVLDYYVAGFWYPFKYEKSLKSELKTKLKFCRLTKVLVVNCRRTFKRNFSQINEPNYHMIVVFIFLSHPLLRETR